MGRIVPENNLTKISYSASSRKFEFGVWIKRCLKYGDRVMADEDLNIISVRLKRTNSRRLLCELILNLTPEVLCRSGSCRHQGFNFSEINTGPWSSHISWTTVGSGCIKKMNELPKLVVRPSKQQSMETISIRIPR
jgi:hypothetical protein